MKPQSEPEVEGGSGAEVIHGSLPDRPSNLGSGVRHRATCMNEEDARLGMLGNQ